MERYTVTVHHGESNTVYCAVDNSQPESEQPCVVRSWSTRADGDRARFLATDFCERHNAKEAPRR